jgi:hypothetical protein
VSSLRSLLPVFAFALSISAAACTADDTATDDLAGTTSQDGALDGDKADASGVYTYFAIEPDLRKCAAPLCGGHFVHRVNLGTTRCNDGVYRASCYVGALDLSKLGLSDSDLGKVTDAAGQGGTTLLLKGTIGTTTIAGKNVGVFKATEAWLAGTSSTPDGVFVKVHDNGVRCFAAPCSNLEEDKLNSSRNALDADVDYSLSGATERQIDAAVAKYESDGVIIAGDRYTVRANGHTAKGRTATQYWTKVLGACYVGGCSAELCTDHPGAVSTCIWEPADACYATATCERQVDGSCGWDQTDDLMACLATPPST